MKGNRAMLDTTMARCLRIFCFNQIDKHFSVVGANLFAQF